MTGMRYILAIFVWYYGTHFGSSRRALPIRGSDFDLKPRQKEMWYSGVKQAEDMLSNDITQERCTRDTGGTCFLHGCYEWRKNATCSWGKCMCPSNMCAYRGECILPELLPTPSAPKCEIDTGASCAFESCHASRNAVCSGWSVGFSTGPTPGRCVCSALGTCAVDGRCVESPTLTKPPEQLNASKIICPVLAGLYNQGIMVPDQYGRVERFELQKAIREGLNADLNTAVFFGQFTVGYSEADVDERFFRMGKGKLPGGEKRYLNIFRMVDNKDVKHQIGANVRGGPIDPACPTYPCEKRFDEFFAKFAIVKSSESRIYAKELGDIAGNIFKKGYHGVAARNTLFTKALGFTAREFLALCGFLIAFGHKDEKGELYIKVDEFRTMEMEGVFPKEWKKPANEWGNAEVQWKCMNLWQRQKVAGFPRRGNMLIKMRLLVDKWLKSSRADE